VIVDSAALPSDAAAFAQRLASSLAAWNADGRRGVWLQLPLSAAELVPVAVSQGFVFHHAEPGHVMLTAWLPATRNTLPANASHVVGVGAFLLNRQGQVLVVQERSGPAARPGFWKLPTGVVDGGEEIHAAAVREVKEETDIDAEFLGVVGFRQAHGVAFGKDDLFFLCALRLKEGAGEEITPQPSEIAAARWMTLEEWNSMVHVADETSVWGHLNKLSLAWSRGEHPLISAHSLPMGSWRPGHNTVYTPVAAPLNAKL
jgi:8-oxo-dGTP pyrophosphatase MutT (NUDIX family)